MAYVSLRYSPLLPPQFSLAAAMKSGASCARMEAVENLSNSGPSVVRRKDRHKSRITNGSCLLLGIDGRSPWVRRCKDVIAAHLSDLGGEDNTSTAERSIVRRCAVLTTELERLEAKFATVTGEANNEYDLDLYQRMTNTLRRSFEAIGLQRRAKDCGLTLGDLLREDQRQQREAAAARAQERQRMESAS